MNHGPIGQPPAGQNFARGILCGKLVPVAKLIAEHPHAQIINEVVVQHDLYKGIQ